jgi:hypothetical protein
VPSTTHAHILAARALVAAARAEFLLLSPDDGSPHSVQRRLWREAMSRWKAVALGRAPTPDGTRIELTTVGYHLLDYLNGMLSFEPLSDDDKRVTIPCIWDQPATAARANLPPSPSP